MIARMGSEPALDAWVFMRGVIIDHQVDIKFSRHTLVHLLEEGQILLMAMSSFAPGQHAPAGDVQGSKQRGSAVTHIIMTHALDVAQAHWEIESPMWKSLDELTLLAQIMKTQATRAFA